MAVVVLGLFSQTIQGIDGALLLSLAHGVVSPALFLLVGGVLYDRYHTRTLRYYRGMTALSRREFMLLLPLLIVAVIFGIFPNIVLETVHVSTTTLLSIE